MRDGSVAWREGLLHRLDLGWMDDLLAGEAELRSELRLDSQGLQVSEVNGNDINGLQAEGCRRGNRGLTGIEQLDGFLRPDRADGSGVILAAEDQRIETRVRGNFLEGED